MRPLTRTLAVPFVLLMLAGGHGAPPAAAQTEAVSAQGVSGGEVRELIQTLEDEAARNKLIGQLNALIEATRGDEAPDSSAGARLIADLSQRMNRLSRELVAGARVLVDAPRLFAWLRGQFSDAASRALWLETLWKVALVLAAGLLGEGLARTMLGRPRRALEGRDDDAILLRLPVLLARTVIDLVPIGVFLAVSYGVLPLVEAGDVARLVALVLINATVLARGAIAVARMVLVPRASGLRVLPISDVNANYAFIWTRRVANVGVYGYFLAEVAGLLGMAAAGVQALLTTVGLILALMLVVLILQQRTAVAGLLRGETGAEGGPTMGALRGRLADIWHVLAILYVAAVFGVWALGVEGGFERVFVATVMTAVILGVARLATLAVRRAVRRGFALRDEVRRQFPSLEARVNRYIPVLQRTGVTIIHVIALFSLLEAWGIDALGWLGTGFGQRFTGGLITIAAIIIGAVLLWEVVSSAIERYLERGSAAVSARARTLLPLLRTTILVVLVTLVSLVVLSELGINIAPLLAGAGVVGLAVGFGSQALVRDIITGVFILMEDQFTIGDVVRIGTHAGVVEDISLRTIRLRDLAGTVHIVPFGEVTTVENLTKGFSRYVFNVGVAYNEDTDQVTAVLYEIGADMQADPEYKDLIIEPLEVLGVDSFGDSAVVIKARITTLPIKQWTVGREFNRRMKQRFDELGIEIPYPHRTLYFGADKSGSAPPVHVRTAAEGDAGAARPTAPAPARPAPQPTPRRGGLEDSDDGNAG